MSNSTDSASLRRQIYGLLIVVTLAMVCSRILGAMRAYEPILSRADPADTEDPHGNWPARRPEPMPTFQSNDRSRWATIRAVVDQGTYVIGERELDPQTGKYKDKGITFDPPGGWDTVDKVLNPETLKFYSSKPPLLSTLIAGEYWLLKHVFGWSIVDDRWYVVRLILLTVNALPLLLYLVLLSRLVERFGTTDWGRLYVMVAACFGTYLTTFATSLNNHTPAACTALFALYAALKGLTLLESSATTKEQEQEEKVKEIAASEEGKLGEQAPASEEPGGANPVRSPCPRVPVSPCLFFALAGLLASFTAAIELPAASFAALLLFVLLLRAPRQTLLWAVPAALIPVAGFFATNYAAIGQLRPAYSEFGGPWYEYEGSHWKPDPVKPKRGIDWAKLKESRVAYAFNFLIGHHGLFSLTPMFLLSLAGVVWTLRRGMMPRAGPEPPADQPSLLQATLHKLRSEPFLLAAMTAILSVVVIGYLLWKSDNYGGWTSGPRWLFWLTPFWLLTMLPVVGQLAARRWGRVLALALLMVSVVSASFTSWNPWRHPWLYQFLDSLGLIPY